MGANGTGSSTPYTFTSTNQYQPTGSGTAANGQVAYIGSYGLTITFAAGTSYGAGMQYTVTAGLNANMSAAYTGSLTGAAMRYVVIVGTGSTSSSTPFTYTSTDPTDPSGSGTATNGETTAVGDHGLTISFAATSTYTAGSQFIMQGANDDIGHGTYVAQLIAGGTSSSSYTTGVCPQCDILPIRVGGYASGTTSEDFSTFTIAQGIIDAANYPGVQVINLSLGGGSDPADNQLTCPGAATVGAMQCAINFAMSKDITVVAAAGNYNSDSPLYPAYIPGVVSVAGIDQSNNMETWSNHNGLGEYWVDVAAPGCYITDEAAIGNFVPASFCGTSAASPYVAGETALLYMADPDLTPAQALTIIEQSATNPVYQCWEIQSGATSLQSPGAGLYTGSAPNVTYTVTVSSGSTATTTAYTYASNDPNDPSGSGAATNGITTPIGQYGVAITFADWQYAAGDQFTTYAGLPTYGTVNSDQAVLAADAVQGYNPTTTTSTTTTSTTTTSTTTTTAPPTTTTTVPPTTTSTTTTTVPPTTTTSTTTTTVPPTTTTTVPPTTTTSTTTTTAPPTTTTTAPPTTTTTAPPTTTTTVPPTTTTTAPPTTTTTVPPTTTTTVPPTTTPVTLPFTSGGGGFAFPPIGPTPSTTVVATTLPSAAPTSPTTTSPAPITAPGSAPVGSVFALPGNVSAAARSAGSGANGAANPAGPGYWAVTRSGKVNAYDGAPYFGSATNRQLHHQLVVGVVPTTDGHGYWLLTRNGTVLSFGDAHTYGPRGRPVIGPVAAMAPTRDNRGYWLVTAIGNVSAYGDAAALAGARTNKQQPVVGIAATPDGHGYWLVNAVGEVYRFGDAQLYSASAPQSAVAGVIGIVVTSDGHGYWLLLPDGRFAGFGDAS